MPKKCHFASVIGVACACVSLAGCGDAGEELPALVRVTGSVTLAGKPLSGAVLLFSPEAADAKGRGRISMGTTDEQGRFELMYNTDTSGAAPGKYIVSISKSAEGGPDDPEEETLDPKYNINSELTARVLAGRANTFEFDLKEGE